MAIDGVDIEEPVSADKIVATDRVDGKDHQSMKLMLGSDGVTEGWVGSVNPIPVQPRRAATVNYGQVDVGDSATLMLAANANRIWCMFYNDGDSPCSWGDDGSVTFNNAPKILQYGETPPLPSVTAWYGCSGAGLTVDMRYVELEE